MYLFYEHHRDTNGVITLTELRLSSYPDWLRIQFKNHDENTAFEMAKTILKNAPVAFRAYDAQLKIWSFLGAEWGPRIITKMEATIPLITPLKLIEVEDLHLYARVDRYDPKRKQEIKPEDFFYQHAPTTTVMPKESVVKQLTALLQTTESELVSADKDTLKRLYRRACLRLHPDRNNGDGRQMSELNMLWGIYNA